MRRMKASHPDYQEFNQLWQDNATIKNPQLFTINNESAQMRNDLGEVEARAIKSTINEKMKTLLRDASTDMANWIDLIEVRLHEAR